MPTPEAQAARAAATHSEPKPNDSIKRRLVWVVLFFLSVGGLVIMTVSGIKNRNYISCNAQQVEVLIEYQREASIAAREEREAHDLVRRAQYSNDKAAERVAITRYFEIRELADQRRSKAPLPELPQTVCGRDPNGARR